MDVLNSRHSALAAYAMDALDEGGARKFERHLSRCRRCQGELTDYHRAGLFGLLRDAAETGMLNPLLDTIPHQRTPEAADEPPAVPLRRRLLSCRSRLRRVLLLVGR
ncbi:zf-HC2 domain-containing protein [Amycolatopsis magusensis]|uniref:Anti-sigma factor RsiW n=1 Tax=Amycolatopsis magusensis TaxID=882444 RepID=A0ABS4PNB4_9PSEU|nr:zf-HC2 domain-containing protein [Amycolatopsis magusensis]MBP2180887.1 anti-sigma factor RsiW [Amycolatopsis magusensis]MDI5975965.1 zf-HC2 domain-containing protein [Amycolatopsis magusensis]